MKKEEAKKKFTFYLKSHNIAFFDTSENDLKSITLVYHGMNLCPDEVLEGCVFFWDDCAEVRVYYNENASNMCKANKQNHGELFRLFNYLAAEFWPYGADFCGNNLYNPEHFYNPRIYMTQDDCYDITLTFTVNYDFYEVATLETEDFITASCPDIMNRLAPAIFGVLLEGKTVEDAIMYLGNAI